MSKKYTYKYFERYVKILEYVKTISNTCADKRKATADVLDGKFTG